MDRNDRQISRDPDAMARHAGSFDMILDTVSAPRLRNRHYRTTKNCSLKTWRQNFPGGSSNNHSFPMIKDTDFLFSQIAVDLQVANEPAQMIRVQSERPGRRCTVAVSPCHRFKNKLPPHLLDRLPVKEI
jgi:hypothetical protein